jgi:hypothetical protein
MKVNSLMAIILITTRRKYFFINLNLFMRFLHTSVSYCGINMYPLLGNACETNNWTAAIDRQQLHKFATVLGPLLGSGPRATVKVLLEAVFSIGPLRSYITQPAELSWKSACKTKFSAPLEIFQGAHTSRFAHGFQTSVCI